MGEIKEIKTIPNCFNLIFQTKTRTEKGNNEDIKIC